MRTPREEPLTTKERVAMVLLVCDLEGIVRIGREGSASPRSADAATVNLIEDNMAASNAGDLEALRETVTEGSLTAISPDNGDVIGETTGGADAFYKEVSQTSQLQTTSEFVQDDNGLVSATYSEGGTTGMLVFKIEDGKIAHTWVFMYER